MEIKRKKDKKETQSDGVLCVRGRVRIYVCIGQWV